MIPGEVCSGRILGLGLVGIVLLAIPGGLTLAEPVPDRSTTAVITPTPPSIVNLTDTPTNDSTPTGTSTTTPTTTPESGGSNGDSTDTQQIVVDDHVGSPDSGTGANCENAEYVSIQAAVTAASPGQTVRVCAGHYTESIVVNTSNLVIRADGEATIDAGVKRGFHVTSSRVTIRGFDVRTVAGAGIWIEGADRVLVQNNSIEYTGENGVSDSHNDGIRLEGSSTSAVVNNTVTGFEDSSISLEEDDSDDASISVDNRITGNTLSGFPGYADYGIWIGRRATGTLIRNNTVVDHRMNPDGNVDGRGIKVAGNDTRLLNNTIKRPSSHGIDIGTVDDGVVGVVISGNTVHNSQLSNGVHVGYHASPGNFSVRIVDNVITNNNWNGIYLDGRFGKGDVEIHRNLISNNAMGIQNGNPFGESSLETAIVNATNNIWDCGGPSGGLEDPYTQRMANGSGDPVSAGDEPGVSNVHFDPFRVHNPSSCPEALSNPTPTPSPTPARTPTPTSTPTPAPDIRKTTGGGDDDAQSSAGGNGTAGSGGVGTSAASTDSIGDSADSPSDDTAPEPPTGTPSATPSPTRTPTPMVEPGFGGVTVVVSIVVLVLLAVCPRFTVGGGRER